MLYLLKQDTLEALRSVEPTAISVDQHLAFEANRSAFGGARSLRTSGDSAEFDIIGVLTPRPDLFAQLFGGGNTAYRDIQTALRTAQENPSVRRVLLNVDSPGGTVAGLFETLDVISAFKASGKKLQVRATMACSAAYAIAAAAGQIEALSDGSMFGSIGVATSIFVSDRVVDIASTGAPNKRPDVKTSEGRAVVRAELDEIHALFVDRIAAGRGVSAGKVGADFGKGSTFLAREAKRRGMIDKLGSAGAASLADDEAFVARAIEAFQRGDQGEPREQSRCESNASDAQIVADIVTGKRSADPSEIRGRDCATGLSDAETVAAIVTGKIAGYEDDGRLDKIRIAPAT